MKAILVGPSIELSQRAREAWVKKRIRPRPELLIGVDGGIQFLRSEKPEIIVGDWDSGDVKLAQSLARKGSAILTLPQKKEYSDLHFALETIADLPLRELLLVGFTGGRPDHLLAVLAETARFARKHASRTRFQKIAAIGPEAEYHFLTDRQPPLEFKRDAGALVSVFAWEAKAQDVRMKGFEYCLTGASLELSSRGLSNQVRARRAMISVGQGTLVVVIPHGTFV